jgi:hypothetical protein
VRLICEWPRSSITTRGWTLSANSKLAAECLKSWKQISGNSALPRIRLKSSRRLAGSTGVSIRVVKTKPASRRPEPSDEAFLALACTMESQRLGDEVENRELPWRRITGRAVQSRPGGGRTSG